MQPVEEFLYLVLAAQREGNRILTEALRPLDLTPSQAEVLRVLQEHQPLSLIALGDLLVCESGSPSRLVNGLVEADLVKRVPSASNGRMVTLTLTAAGEGRQYIALASEAAGAQARPLAVPALLLRVLGLTNPVLRESVELLYEFNGPLLFDGSKYCRAFGGTPTSHQEAMRQTVAWYRESAAPKASQHAEE